MKESDGDRFFVKLPLGAIRIMREVKSAFILFWWYVGRVTVEYVAGNGIRVGGVYGTVPYSDSRIAEDLTSCGLPCNAHRVWNMRQALRRASLITWLRTPAGQRTLVIDSDKFSAEKAEPLPDWARSLVRDALSEYLANHPCFLQSGDDLRSLETGDHSPKTGDHSPKTGESIKRRNGNEAEKKEDTSSRKRDGASPLFASAKEYAFSRWTRKFGQQPTWAEKDYVMLSRLLKRQPGLTVEEFRSRWMRYLADADLFIAKQEYSLAFFCSRFDAYLKAKPKPKDDFPFPYRLG